MNDERIIFKTLSFPPSLSLSLIDVKKAPISNFNTLVGSKVFTKHKK